MKDVTIRREARQFCLGLLGYRGSTHSKCFIVSAALTGYLNAIGIDCFLEEGHLKKDHHFWIGFKDGRIIDATATQFGLKNVWLQRSTIHHRLSRREQSNTAQP